ncbi:MAG: sugar phosphate isomerase/epimerase family protein [Planctomycetota bacterium]
MKKGLNAWAFPPQVAAREAIRYAKRAGYDSIELNLDETGEIGLKTPAADLKKLATYAKRQKLEISSVSTGLYWAYNMASEDAAERKQAAKVLSTQLETAAALGCDAILVIPGVVKAPFGDKPPVDPDACWDRALEGVRAAVAQAEDLGVTIAIENVWNMFLLSATEMRDFIDACESKAVGCYFDPANVLKCGLPDQWVRVLGKRIKRIHFKDFRRSVGTLDGFVHLLEGDMDYPAFMDALKTARYNGYVTAEVFPYGHALWESQIWTTSLAMDYILGRKRPKKFKGASDG